MKANVKVEDPKPSLMWEREEFERVIAGLKEHARETLIADGFHIPIAFLFATIDPSCGEERKNVIPVAGNFDSDEEKDAFASILRTLAHQTKAVALVFITEIWMIHRTEDTLERPAEAADRAEALMLSSEHVRFGSQLAYAPITRDAENKPLVAEWEVQPPAHKTRGRFVHILPSIN